jgi:prepilin-type N-terminal cleavage/methylation domain-containing protein
MEAILMFARPTRPTLPKRAAVGRGAFSLMEVMAVLTVTGILISMAAPSFRRALEQSRADIAGANLRAIWSAERLYWLDHHAYTQDLDQLVAIDLIDPTIVSSAAPYSYSIAAAADNTFSAAATRSGSTHWSGEFTIDESGVTSGVVQGSGDADIQAAFQ